VQSVSKQVTLKARLNDKIASLNKLDKAQRNTGLVCAVLKVMSDSV
jgi:hypothetical protein